MTRDPQSMSGQQTYPVAGLCRCGHSELVHASTGTRRIWCSTYRDGVKCPCNHYEPEVDR